MDYLSLKAAVAEAGKKLSGTKVVDAWQAGSREIALVFRGGPGLVLSVDPVRPGLFLVDSDQLPKRSSSPFTDLLRARIKGTTLGSILLPHPGERVVILILAATWPVKAGAPLQLVFEDMGRRSNLAVVEEGRILQPLRPVSREKSPARPMVAGEPYRDPPVREVIPLEDVTPETLPQLRSWQDSKTLYSGVGGLSPYSAAQVLLKAQEGGPEDPPAPEDIVRTLGEMSAACTGENGFLHHTAGRTHLTPFSPVFADPSDRVDRFGTFSAAAAEWKATRGLETGEPGDESSRLEKGLRGHLDRLSSAMDHVNLEEKRCLAHNEVRVMAEALLINANRVKPGSASVILPDPYDPTLDITVPLDPGKNPQENANDLFNSARRLKRGLKEVVKRRRDIGEKRAQVLEAMKALEDRNEPEPARRLLGSPAHDTPRRDRGKQTAYGGPGRKHVVEGFTVLVGKSSTDNEKVTFQAAGPNDLWLHARDYPGSHVVILTGKKNVPDRVLYEAAALAAAGSGARNDAAPEIMVTERKWVRKLKGGKPGQVTVERYRTVRPRIQKSGDRRKK